MSVQTKVEFLSKRTERPIYYASSAGRNAAHKIDQPMNIVTVEVDDARQREDDALRDEFGQHPSGFELLEFPTVVDSFLDPAQIETVYEAEIANFLKAVTGCYRVHIFDHTVRASDPELREIKNIREPAYLVHNDYTSNSGFVCLQENLGEDAASLAQGRFQIINVWRPLVDPVEDFPLALCDARSLTTEDLVDTERRAPNHVGEIQLALHDPRQHWYFYSQMRPPEVLLFKTFDSIDGGVHPCSIHSAIRLPDAPADARPRESVETRAFVFYR
ncbi:MAG: CmcJ/NvfI family oxidoreductase [Gammaproteobacteria bacterium]